MIFESIIENEKVVAINISCDDKNFLSQAALSDIQGELNEYTIETGIQNVGISQEQFEILQKNGFVEIKITETEDADIDDDFSINLGDEDEEETIGTKGKNCFKTSSARGKRKAGEVLADYLERDLVIKEAVIRRGMAVYRTSFTFSNGEVYADSWNAGAVEINLLEKINDSIEIFSTGMDGREVVEKVEQVKDGFTFIMLRVHFNDGDVIGKYKLINKDICKQEVDISF